jgi:HK97 family phage prohead protease
VNREYFLALEQSRAYRSVTWAASDDNAHLMVVEPPEMRKSKDGDKLTYLGYAYVSEFQYKVYGGPPYGWVETIARGAAKRTLLNNADVNFLVNHSGLSLARTKSGSLILDEDGTGLRNLAEMNPKRNDVNDLYHAVNDKDVDEQSFGFRVVADEWMDEDGEPSNMMEGTQRRILEVSLNKGDVSAVNYGANPATSGGFRSLDRALSDLRAGKPLSDEQRAELRSFAAGIDETTVEKEVPPEVLARRRLFELAVA